ncbi:MAG: 2-C-methyl-D-erythritol 2,4-cyclodiphosphate synthase [Psittacicella sp.]
MLRIGQGYDLHSFGGEKSLIIGGILIETDKKIKAHSDGDVLLHSIIDSMFGALALGDLGKFYPDTDPKFSNANSIDLLKDAYKKVKDLGYKICNMDSTIILESPKIGKYSANMQKNISKALNIPENLISIKATTNEKLGFLGRAEAIACMTNILLTKE